MTESTVTAATAVAVELRRKRELNLRKDLNWLAALRREKPIRWTEGVDGVPEAEGRGTSGGKPCDGSACLKFKRRCEDVSLNL